MVLDRYILDGMSDCYIMLIRVKCSPLSMQRGRVWLREKNQCGVISAITVTGAGGASGHQLHSVTMCYNDVTLRNLCYYGRHVGKKSPWAGLGLIEPGLGLHTAQIFKFSQNSGTLQLGSASLVPYFREAGVRIQSQSLNKNPVFMVVSVSHHSIFKTQKIYIDG